MTNMRQKSGTLITVFVATSGHSGVDRLIRHLVPSMARRGYPVDVLKIRDHGPVIGDQLQGVQLIDLKVKHVYSSFPALVRYLKHRRPDVMLTDKDRVNRTAILARAWSRVPTRLVLSSGTTISIDLDNRGAFERWLQKRSMKYLYPYAENIVVTSEGVADDMAEYTGLARKRIQVVPCPVVPNELFGFQLPRPDHPWFRTDAPPVILGVGELGPRKDFLTLVQAFARLRANQNCRLVILGKGNQRDHLLSVANELGVAKDIDLPGFEPNPYPFMAHAAMLAMSSRWEGLGFVLIETLALGTPVVSTDCPSGPREILDGGRYGRLVPVGDAERLARAMAETLLNPPPAAFLQEAARPYEIERSTSAYLTAMGLDPRTSD
ncbi:MAG: glycosyltransferase [Desulfobacterales bacterium]